MVKDLVIKCRGLPYSCDESSLRKFLGDSGISKVNIIMRDGKAAGDAFVHYSNEDDYKRALKKDREHMGHRYIEVMPADQDTPSSRGPSGRDRDRGGSYRDRRDRDYDYGRGSSRMMSMMMAAPFGEGVVRLRGLPYGARERDIYDFFAPLSIVPDGIILPDDRTAAKTNGEAYIEVFAASYGEMVQFCDEYRLRVPRGTGGGGGYGGMARGGYEDSYGGFGAFARPGGGDRPAAILMAEQVTRILMADLSLHLTLMGALLKLMIHTCVDPEDLKTYSPEEWILTKVSLLHLRILGAMIVPQLEQRLDTAIHGTNTAMEVAVVVVLYVFVISGETTKTPEGHLPLHLVDVNGLGRGTHSK
ncbi:hypothetical protein ANCCEY_04746 [Ancylostoma ceylanicum]|uniref:RRM domain-containing protein n=1 Tax=Ancylostoma ceylanicum TaxID=53326 RepID=A0A0D6LVQ5_9BILA|nr:hypothetical protein ANCCEY_04746 [Ancylostoma ceylanicum]